MQQPLSYTISLLVCVSWFAGGVRCEEPMCIFDSDDNNLVREEYIPSKEDCPCFHHLSNLTQVNRNYIYKGKGYSTKKKKNLVSF